MWEYIAIAINFLLAILATWINTERDTAGKKRAVFKSPSLGGWVVIVLCVVLTIVQLFTQIEKEKTENRQKIASENQRIRDSANIQFLIQKSKADSISWERNFSLIDTTNVKINQARELVNTSYKMQMSVFDTAKKILYATEDLQNPFSVEYVTLSIDFRFNSKVVNDYWRKAVLIKDSLERKLSRAEISQIQGTEVSFLKNSKNKIKGFDSESRESFLFKLANKEHVYDKIEDGGNYLIWISPNLKPFDSESVKHYDAIFFYQRRVDSMGVFGERTISIDFKDSIVNFILYFKVGTTLLNSGISGVKSLIGKYLLAYSELSDYSIERVGLVMDDQLKKVMILDLKKSKVAANLFYHKFNQQDLRLGLLKYY